jgi:uncharacterized protein (UPF0262 family)
MSEDSKHRLKAVFLDGDSIGIGSADQEHERQIAIYDLIEDNVFGLPSIDAGPYSLTISLHESKLMLDIAGADGEQKAVHILSLTPFRRILRDYFMICESYYDAIRTQTAAQIEAIDMGRRGLHNEGADLLLERITGKINCDKDTARRLFTLITALHWKG